MDQKYPLMDPKCKNNYIFNKSQGPLYLLIHIRFKHPVLERPMQVPQNRLPQARLLDCDETWHICSPYGPSARNGVFFKFGLVLPVLERHL